MLFIKRSIAAILPLFFVLQIFTSCKKNTFESQEVSAPVPVVPAQRPTYDSSGMYDKTEQDDSNVITSTATYTYGYTDKPSYCPSDSQSLYLSNIVPQKNATLKLKDANDNDVLSLSVELEKQEVNSTKPWLDGLRFRKTASLKLDNNLKSGVYFWNGNIPFVLKSAPGSYHDITVVYPSNTANAYSQDGGKSLYAPTNQRAYVVSFSRYIDKTYSYSVPFLKWITQQNYDVNYVTDKDLDDYSSIENSRVLIISGHSEYWSRKARENFDRFVNAGKNALILSGNTMWCQVRYNNSKNLLICYNGGPDPLNNTGYATINWDNPSLNYPIASSTGTSWNHGGYGNRLPNRWNGYKITNATSPLLEGTGLKNGDILTIPTSEYDGAPLVKNILPGSTEIPVIDNNKLHFDKVELIGYDFGITAGSVVNAPGVGTFIVFRKSKTSGIVVNTATEMWCTTGIDGTDKEKVRLITKNMINKSLLGEDLFTR